VNNFDPSGRCPDGNGPPMVSPMILNGPNDPRQLTYIGDGQYSTGMIYPTAEAAIGGQSDAGYGGSIFDGVGSAMLQGAEAYGIGLFNGLENSVYGFEKFVENPVVAIQGVADGLGTLCGNFYCDPGGTATSVENAIVSTLTDTGKLGYAMGNIVGGTILGAGVTGVGGAVLDAAGGVLDAAADAVLGPASESIVAGAGRDVAALASDTASVEGAGAAETAAVKPGSFSVVDWTGYPANLPKVTGPVNLVEGAEYTAARRAADAPNNAVSAVAGSGGTTGPGGTNTSTPSATLSVTGRGLVTANTPGGVYYSNGVTMNATVSGVASGNLVVSQNINQIVYTLADGSVVVAAQDQPDLANGQPWFNGSAWNGGYGLDSSGQKLSPQIQTQSGGSLSVTFYDGPGFIPSSTARFPITQRQDFTTTIATSSGTTLASQNWHVTVTVDNSGHAVATFHNP